MALLPEERRENIIASLFKYLEGFTLVSIYFANSGIKEEDINEWVRADVMFPTPRYARQVDAQGNMGAEALVMLSMNIFKKQSEAETNMYSQTAVADALSNMFRVPLGIPIKDYVESAGTGTNRIGTLQTSTLEENNLGLVQAQGVYQYNLTSTMRWVQKWEVPS